MSISTNLRREMISRDMTTAQLSELSGVSKANLSKYLDGKYKPTQDVLERIANALGCNADELGGNNVKKYRKPGNLSIQYCAKKLGISEQTLRIGLQQGKYSFGEAIKMKRFVYQITPERFEKYLEGMNIS